jgi:hypothetical protein
MGADFQMVGEEIPAEIHLQRENQVELEEIYCALLKISFYGRISHSFRESGK